MNPLRQLREYCVKPSRISQNFLNTVATTTIDLRKKFPRLQEMRKTDSEQCLICGKTGRITRGLCVLHYNRFRAVLATIPQEKQTDFEEELIAAGKLAPSAKGRHVPKEENEFAMAAEKFMAGKLGDDLANAAEKLTSKSESESPKKRVARK